MRLIIAAILIVASIDALAQPETIEWTLQMQRENGAPLTEAEIKQANVYRNGAPFAVISGAATKYTLPPCLTPAAYAISITDTGTPALESKLSASINKPSTVTAKDCAPKAPILISP